MKRTLVTGYAVIGLLQLSTALLVIYEEQFDSVAYELKPFLEVFHAPGVFAGIGLFGLGLFTEPSPQQYVAMFAINLAVLLCVYTFAVVLLRFLFRKCQKNPGG